MEEQAVPLAEDEPARPGDDRPDGLVGAQPAWLASTRAALVQVETATGVEARLAAAAQLARYTDRLIAELVEQARADHEPLSWARIGGALGMTRQAANERFGDAARQGAQIRRLRRARRLAHLRSRAVTDVAAGPEPSEAPR
jgi:hypothetical protein